MFDVHESFPGLHVHIYEPREVIWLNIIPNCIIKTVCFLTREFLSGVIKLCSEQSSVLEKRSFIRDKSVSRNRLFEIAISCPSGMFTAVAASGSLASDVFSVVAHDVADQERTALAPGADAIVSFFFNSG